MERSEPSSSVTLPDDVEARDDLAVLVASCDEFTDLWPAFFELFFHFWPDCPYPVYLGSDKQVWNDPRVRALTVPGFAHQKGWSQRVRGMLERIPQRYVLLLLEDFLLTAHVDTERIRHLASYMRSVGAGYLRLFPSPGPSVLCAGRQDIGENAAGEPYRICTQASLWDKVTLLELLRDGESIWDFEHGASRRSTDSVGLFLSVTRRVGVAGDTPTIENAAVPYLCTAVVRGVWLRNAVELCRRHGIEPDLNRRPMEPRREYFRRVILPHWPGGRAIGAVWLWPSQCARAGGALVRRVFRFAARRLGAA